MMMNTLTLVPFNQWRGLCMVDIETFLDCFFIIVRATTLLSTKN